MVHAYLYKNCIPGPSVQPGRFEKSVHLPNMNTDDDSSLTLTNIDNCLKEIETCSNGMTLALWAKVSQTQSYLTPHFLSSSSVSIFTHIGARGFVTRFPVQESASQSVKYSSKMKLQFDQWHLVAITYSAQSGLEVYLNGCLVEITASAPNSVTVVTSNMIVGCNSQYSSCINGNFDDVRFWTSKKDKYFVWNLWSM